MNEISLLSNTVCGNLEKDKEGKGFMILWQKKLYTPSELGRNLFLKANDNEILRWKSVS